MRRAVAGLLLVIALALPVEAQRVFQSTIVVPMSTRNGGTYTFANVAVPTDVGGIQISIDVSEASDPLPEISGALEGSLDGGNTWAPAGSFARPAGPKGTNRTGGPLTTTGASFIGGDFWSATQNVNRRLRGSATIGGTMRFAMTVQPL